MCAGEFQKTKFRRLSDTSSTNIESKDYAEMKFFGTTFLLIILSVKQTQVSAKLDDVIAADQMSFHPAFFLVYTQTKLSWHDADGICRFSNDSRRLFHILSDVDLEVATVQGKLNITSLWIGLVSETTTHPSPIWSNCQKYNESDYDKTFESPHSVFSQTKRCALLTGTYQWEWRDCGEYHGFACENVPSGGDVMLMKKYFPRCGSEKRSFCPQVNCLKKEQCSLKAKINDNSKYMVYDDMPLTWNDAYHACSRNGRRLASVLDTTVNSSRILGLRLEGWIGLYSFPSLFKYSWTSCDDFKQDNIFYWKLEPQSTKPCAFLKGLEIEWRTCSERHGFVCEEPAQGSSDTDIRQEYLPSEEDMDTRICTNVLDTCRTDFDGCAGIVEDTSRVESTGFCVKPEIEKTTAPPEATTLTETEPVSTKTSHTVMESDSTSLELTTGTDVITTNRAVETTTPDRDTTEKETTDTEQTTEVTTYSTKITTEYKTTVETTEIPTRNIYSCNRGCNCRCKCIKTVYITLENWTILQEQKVRWISDILDDLSLNKSSFSSMRRRYNSATDTRESVATIGSLGVIVLVVILVGVLLLDLSALVTDFRMLSKTLSKVFHR